MHLSQTSSQEPALNLSLRSWGAAEKAQPHRVEVPVPAISCQQPDRTLTTNWPREVRVSFLEMRSRSSPSRRMSSNSVCSMSFSLLSWTLLLDFEMEMS